MFNWKKHQIKNFDPNKVAAKRIISKRIKTYLIPASLFFIIELLSITLLWTLGTKELVQNSCLAFVAFNSLVTVIYLGFIDMGAARIIRKSNFKGQGINDLQQGHTYYFILKASGIIRLIINLFFTSTFIIIAIVSFVV